jgi:hypothetical protein
MAVLFVVGLGLIYLLLGTQFRSYLQPFLVLTTVPMAFVGVTLGLFFSANPLSLFTLYGAIALAGIAANDAIVLIATANRRQDAGASAARAVVLAARRRVVPILITSLTTIAGLLSLALGLGGESLIWGPLATAIVWGLAFSTLLTLFVVPLSYQAVARWSTQRDLVDDLLSRLEPADQGGWRAPLQQIAYRLLPLGMKRDAALEAALQDPAHRQRYEEGLAALRDGDTTNAIRAFEHLATAEPNVAAFNLYAVQANLQMMQAIGWDVGYMDRARKYLVRARRMDPGNPRIPPLEKLCGLIDAQRG